MAQTEGRLVSRIVAFGDDDHDYRVWIAQNVGDIEHHYFPTVREAVAAVADGLGDGAMVAGLEERDGFDWYEYYDDRGCDLDELVEEHIERNGDETLQDVFDRM